MQKRGELRRGADWRPGYQTSPYTVNTQTGGKYPVPGTRYPFMWEEWTFTNRPIATTYYKDFVQRRNLLIYHRNTTGGGVAGDKVALNPPSITSQPGAVRFYGNRGNFYG